MTSSCAWCGAPSEGAEQRRGRFVCNRCGAATTDPWPSDAELAAAYGDWYRPESGRFGRAGDTLLRRSRAALARRIDAIAPPGRVVDVGAGDGTLVRAVLATGRDAIGLERGPSNADARIVDASLGELGGDAATVVFWHSLEHLRMPRPALREAARLLVPDGVLIVAVPNADSLQARIFGDQWLALDLPRHLVHLPAHTLLSGLTEDGWRIERVSHVRGGQVLFGWLHGLVGKLPGDLDLYQSIRSRTARARPVTRRRRVAALAAAGLLAPAALLASLVEILLRRGGSVYLEARRG